MAKVEKKEDTKGTRIDAAQRLTRLAGIIAQGHADILGREVIFGEQVESCWSVSVKEGFIHYDLSLKIPLSEMGLQEVCAIEEQPQIATPVQKERSAPGGKGKVGRRGRYEAKKQKKATGALWKIVKKAIMDRRTVSESDAAALIASLNQYDKFVRDEWRAQWNRCVDAVERCLAAAKDGDFKTAELLVKEVIGLTKACHKKYK